ncbi:SusC/RagA family TonB-linked outer membrane protein [Halosquirtibacter xylanolyticus]|uniref:SusC/RagA family TonB-linked outer membrane protein n=1 Tax=Halosquirtibacter xylanolyticus TaxID=3374599 RepID=UPI0037497AAB|nr:SusC/RagA family TonB-linked outer membrane protein [Prolixibacteraceae bacterium]
MKIRSICFFLMLIGALYTPMLNGHVMASPKEMVAQHQKVVKGVVKDRDGQLVVGASVFLKGSSVGTVTDIDGKYVLKLPSKEGILVASYIGYKSQEMDLNGQTVVDFVLIPSTEMIDELVVVGYSTVSKGELTGSVASIDQESLVDVTSPRVESALQGKASGVFVSNAGGQPGSPAKIRIRGKGSLSSNVDPLWVVDGVVGADGSVLSPNEIESVSILKDASATALYGSRGANGVIVLTTKKGKVGVNQIHVNGTFGVSKLNMGNFELMNSHELYDYHKQWNTNPWFTEGLKERNYDWFDQAVEVGEVRNINVAFQGAGEKSSTYVLGDYYSEDGAIKGYSYTKYSARLNNEYQFSDRFRLKTKVSASYKDVSDRQHSLYSMYRYLPWDQPYNSKGEMLRGDEGTTVNDHGDYWLGRDQSNYLYDLQWNYLNGVTYNGSLNVGFDFRIAEGVTFESINSASYNHYVSKTYTDPRSTSGKADKGVLSDYHYTDVQKFTNQLLRFSHSFENVHHVRALFAYEYSDFEYSTTKANGKGVPVGAEILDLASKPQEVEGRKQEDAIQSYIFNLNYMYDVKYMLQFSARRDGASRFGKEKQYGNFATISGAWSLHEEEFMKSLSWVDFFKLRGSYGSVGNMPTSYYGSLGLYSNSYSYNGEPGAFPSQLKNDELTWEKSYMTDIAIELSLWDCLDFSMDLYSKNTSGLLYRVSMPTVSGYSSQWQNIGEMNNKGVELNLGLTLIDRKSITWDLSLNATKNVNRINELYKGKAMTSGNKRYTEGHNMNQWYLKEWAGVNSKTGAPMWFKELEDGTKEITENYSNATRQLLDESSDPDWFGGIQTSFTFRNLTLTAGFNYSIGNYIYHRSRETFDSDGGYSTYNQMKLKDGWSRWMKEGDIATHPKGVEGGNNQAYKPSSRYLEKGDYLRLRNLSLSYQLPDKLLSKIGVNSCIVSVSGDNLFTWTEFSGMDPEAAIVGNTVKVSGDYFSEGTADSLYPQSRKFIFGINLSF